MSQTLAARRLALPPIDRLGGGQDRHRCKNHADCVKTHGRNNSVEYLSAAARIPMPSSMNVRCLLEFHLDILLGNRSKDKHAVKLTTEITVKVLRVFEQNQCLIGG